LPAHRPLSGSRRQPREKAGQAQIRAAPQLSLRSGAAVSAWPDRSRAAEQRHHQLPPQATQARRSAAHAAGGRLVCARRTHAARCPFPPSLSPPTGATRCLCRRPSAKSLAPTAAVPPPVSALCSCRPSHPSPLQQHRRAAKLIEPCLLVMEALHEEPPHETALMRSRSVLRRPLLGSFVLWFLNEYFMNYNMVQQYKNTTMCT